MANKSKAIGTTFESACVKKFTSKGFDARRLALGGSDDRGDVELIVNEKTFCIECKAVKYWARGHIAEWRRQAVTESVNYSKTYNKVATPVLIVKQYGKSLNDAFVHMPRYGGGWSMIYLDEFIKDLTRMGEEVGQ